MSVGAKDLLYLGGIGGSYYLLKRSIDSVKTELSDKVKSLTPASYIVYTEGGIVYARNGKTGDIELSDTDAGKVLQGIINKITGGKILVRYGTYTIKTGVVVSKKVSIECEPDTTFKAGAKITMFTFNKVVHRYGTGLKHCVLDMNQFADVGLLIQDSWMTEHDITVLNVGAGVGVKLLSTDTNFLSLYNRVVVYVKGNSKTAGSIGVDIDATAGRTNFNRISGRAEDLDIGVRIKAGDNNIFEHFDSTKNNIGYDIYGNRNVLLGIFEEANADKGIYVRDGASAIVIPAYFEKRDVEGTGLMTILNFDTIELVSKYPTQTPKIKFAQQGNYSMSLQNNGTVIYVRDEIEGKNVINLESSGIVTYLRGKKATDAIPAGSTRKTVTHGLPAKPNYVFVTPYGNAKIWVENITDTTFDVVTDTAPTANLRFAWYAEV